MDTWNALSNALIRNIRVLTSAGEVWAFTGEEYDDHAVTLYLDEHLEHYEFLNWDVHAGSSQTVICGSPGGSQAPKCKGGAPRSLSIPLSAFAASSARASTGKARSACLSDFAAEGDGASRANGSVNGLLVPRAAASADREPTMSPRARSRSPKP